MNDNTLEKIVDLCLQIDNKAATIYSEFSQLNENVELLKFWKVMSAEEEGHVKFWEKLSILAKEKMIPQVFDHPDETIRELQECLKKIVLTYDACKSNMTVSNQFFLAVRIEFYLLHPSFETFFYTMSKTTDVNNPAENYRKHLERLLDMLEKYGHVSPELEMLGETLIHLWDKNRLLIQQANMDPLTGIYNRRGFFTHIKPLLHYAQRKGLSQGILMADIDDYKRINDTHGHQVGDQVLQNVGSILSATTRDSDIVGRYGGDEFIVFFFDADTETLRHIAEKICAAIEVGTAPLIPVTISVGIACAVFSEDVDQELVDLISLADARLYLAKTTGKNQVS